MACMPVGRSAVFGLILLLVRYVHASANSSVTILGTDQNKDGGRGFVFSINVTNGEVSKFNLFKNLRPVAIAYNDVKEKMYWSDAMSRQIRSARLDGSDETVVLDLPTDSKIEGLTIDTNNELLFYTDTGRDKILRVSINSTDATRSEFELASVDKPRGITVYPNKRLVIWTDWKAWATIEMCHYNGGNRTELINTNINWPNDVTLDERTDTLYWCDAFGRKHSIESVLLNGTGRKLIHRDEASRFYGIKLFEDVLYLTDWEAKSVHLYYINGTKKGEIVYMDFVRPSGLFVLRQSTCEDGRFGSDCQLCGNCSAALPCNKMSGVCMNGCSYGYHGLSCNNTCQCESVKDTNDTCSDWRKENCQTSTITTTVPSTTVSMTVPSTTLTTTVPSTTLTTTVPSTTFTTTTTQSTTSKVSMMIKTLPVLSEDLSTESKDNYTATIEQLEHCRSSVRITIGLFGVGLFTMTALVVFSGSFALRYRQTIHELRRNNPRSEATWSRPTCSSPDYSKEEFGDKTSPGLDVSSRMLHESGQANTDCDNMSEDAFAENVDGDEQGTRNIYRHTIHELSRNNPRSETTGSRPTCSSLDDSGEESGDKTSPGLEVSSRMWHENGQANTDSDNMSEDAFADYCMKEDEQETRNMGV